MPGSGINSATRDMFQKGAKLFAEGRAAESVPLLVRAVEGGDSEAQNLLGLIYLNAMGVKRDPHRAAELFAEAAQAGLKEGHYNYSNLLYNGIGVKRDASRGQRHLLLAAHAGHRPALRVLGFLYHLMGNVDGWPSLSTHCFWRAAAAGDALAQHALGLRLWRGDGVTQDARAAGAWFSSASRQGLARSAMRLGEISELLGTRPAPATDQDRPSGLEDRVGDLPSFTPIAIPLPSPSRQLGFMSEYPDALDGYLCDHLINIATPRMTPSGVVDPATGAATLSDIRTSHSMYCPASLYDATMAQTMERMAAIGGLPPEHAEPLGILRYGPGQEYKPHYDYYTDDRHQAQRISTVFIYLNDVVEGGGTDFPRLGVKVDPAQGKAVKFLNCDAEGRPNPDTLHAGLPVIRGEKWLATLWFWDRPFMWFA